VIVGRLAAAGPGLTNGLSGVEHGYEGRDGGDDGGDVSDGHVRSVAPAWDTLDPRVYRCPGSDISPR
jgi:hypothetical protein